LDRLPKTYWSLNKKLKLRDGINIKYKIWIIKKYYFFNRFFNYLIYEWN
jgi:hypothetical protein